MKAIVFLLVFKDSSSGGIWCPGIRLFTKFEKQNLKTD